MALTEIIEERTVECMTYLPIMRNEGCKVDTRYYYSDGERKAMKSNGAYYYFFGDHLGSTTSVVDRQSGKRTSYQIYGPWGTTRYSSGEQATDYAYTGQMQVDDIYYYNARWPQVPEAQRVGFDPQISRFLQADTLVPGYQGTQAFDRYAYVNNNPLKYTDPTGYFSEDEVLAYLINYFDGDNEQAAWTYKKWQNNKVWWDMIVDAQVGDELFVDSYASPASLGSIEPGKATIMDTDTFAPGPGLRGLKKYDLVALETGSVIEGYDTVTTLPKSFPTSMIGVSISGSISGVESGSLSLEYYYHPYNNEPNVNISSGLDVGIGTGTSGNAAIYVGILKPRGYTNAKNTVSVSASAGLFGVTGGLWLDDDGKPVGWFVGWAPGLGFSGSYSLFNHAIKER